MSRSSPEPTPTQIADALDAAADYLDKYGHCNSGPSTPDGRVCTVVALARVCQPHRYDVPGGTRLWHECLERVAKHLDLPGGTDLVDWNDRPERDRDTVTTVFRDVAIKTRPDAMEITND